MSVLAFIRLTCTAKVRIAMRAHVLNQFYNPQTIKKTLVSELVEKSWCGDQCSMVQALVFANLLLVFAGFGIWYYRDWIWTLFQRWFPKFKVSSSSTETRQNVRLGHMSNPEGSLEQQALVDPTVSQNHQVPDYCVALSCSYRLQNYH